MDEMSKNMSFDYPEKPKFPEQETGHVYFDTGVDESTEAFSKNVKLAAHTEYTSIKNGKIGEGGGSDNDESYSIFKFSGVENTPVPIPDGLIFDDSFFGFVKISGTATNMTEEPVTVEEQIIPYYTANENNVYFGVDPDHYSYSGSPHAIFTISNGMISISSGVVDYQPEGNNTYYDMKTIEWTIMMVDISNV